MTKCVLICDDDIDILAICRFILEDQGWEVHTLTHCNNITDVVNKINPQVILMDNWIPDIGGIAATQAIKSHPDFSEIPVIYFSANNNIKALAQQAGADNFLAKPFNIDDLENIISSVLK
jgi:DNA-binding NtrC family response regulator